MEHLGCEVQGLSQGWRDREEPSPRARSHLERLVPPVAQREGIGPRNPSNPKDGCEHGDHNTCDRQKAQPVTPTLEPLRWMRMPLSNPIRANKRISQSQPTTSPEPQPRADQQRTHPRCHSKDPALQQDGLQGKLGKPVPLHLDAQTQHDQTCCAKAQPTTNPIDLDRSRVMMSAPGLLLKAELLPAPSSAALRWPDQRVQENAQCGAFLRRSMLRPAGPWFRGGTPANQSPR